VYFHKGFEVYTKGTTQNPREVDQGPRRLTRTMKKQPGSHPRRAQERQTKRQVTSKDVKMPNIVKSPPACQEQKLVTYLD
jgi:hypothetical protein